MKVSLYIYIAVDRIQICVDIAGWFAFFKADICGPFQTREQSSVLWFEKEAIRNSETVGKDLRWHQV